MKLRFFIMLLLGVAIILSLTAQQSMSDPNAWLESDPYRKEVIEAAKAGDPKPLHLYLSSIDEHSGSVFGQGGTLRARIGQALLMRAQYGNPPMSLAEIYKERALYIPFATINTGNADINDDLDNFLGYTLVAGCNQPTATDLSIAFNLVNRLETVAKETDNYQYLDTVACIRFRQGKRQEAKQLFEETLRLLKKDLKEADLPANAREQLEAFQHLLLQRISACDDPEADLPLENDALILTDDERNPAEVTTEVEMKEQP